MAVLSVLTFEVGDDLSWSDVLPVCPPVGISRCCCCSDLESEGEKNWFGRTVELDSVSQHSDAI